MAAPLPLRAALAQPCSVRAAPPRVALATACAAAGAAPLAQQCCLLWIAAQGHQPAVRRDGQPWL
ncbi:hypothetical protein, partial [Paenibacillus polymyxa]|uniref:hypothetical protein n=1 Tax=Paenibacillus polymyxa TaxID=1406 RepID=UPI001E63EE54